ncbi:hypothetical protein C8J56DRAFT_1093936 [Mycena floridula]|nr:hypothetical protein C8J56DRAFT_1093936 [Mycena floridula]
MAPVVIPGINVPLFTGPLVLGYMWGYCLYGMLIVQVYLYTQIFPKDRIGFKILIWSMFILESVFTLFTTIAAWNAYGPGWGDVNTLIIIDWSWSALPALNGLLAAMAQGFYIWRIQKLTKSFWIPIFISCVMLMQLVMAFYYGIVICIQGYGIDTVFSLTPEISVWLGGSAACDILITISLVYILSQKKETSRFQQTTGIINKLIRFSIETGAVTSVIALVEAIVFVTSGHKSNIYFVFFLILGELYSNMLMATLNWRVTLASSATTQSFFWADSNGQNPAVNLNTHRVHVSQTTNVAHDDDHDAFVMRDFNSSSTKTTDKLFPHGEV